MHKETKTKRKHINFLASLTASALLFAAFSLVYAQEAPTEIAAEAQTELAPEEITEPLIKDEYPDDTPTENPDEPSEGETEQEQIPEELPTPEKVVLDVPYINQRIGFPNGCEAVSAVMALKYLGIEITPNEFISKYLDMGRAPYYKGGVRYGCDPHEEFPGDPRSKGGWGCYPAVIKKAADKMENRAFTSVVLRDASLTTLCNDYIDKGIPVLFWGTIDMSEPYIYTSWKIEGTERTHLWTAPFHCLLLVGYDKDSYYFNDPWRKKNATYPKKRVEVAYNAIGRHALAFILDSLFEEEEKSEPEVEYAKPVLFAPYYEKLTFLTINRKKGLVKPRNLWYYLG